MAYKPESMQWEDLTKIKGEHGRHIEQLWDEIKYLRERCMALTWHIEHLQDEMDNKVDK